MKNRTLKRSEIDIRDKWRIEDLYESDEAWEKDYKRAEELSASESIYKGRLGDGEDIILKALEECDAADFLVERVYVYAFMRYYEDTANAFYQEMSGKAQMVLVKMNEKYSFMTPELMAVDEAVMTGYLESVKLSEYRHMLEDLLSKKLHSLSECEEKLLAMAGQMAGNPKEIFSKFNNADIKFGNITDEDGQQVELTNAKYGLFMESTDQNVRKQAFEALYRQYGAYINTLAAAYYGNIKQAMFFAKARHYDSTLEMYLSSSFIPVSVYTNLIKTVSDNLSSMHSYVSLRKNVLGVKKLHFYDVYAPMVEDYKLKVSYEEAKEIVIAAMAPLGEDYVEVLKEGFECGWVDVRENVGKRTGAFSWGTYGTHPYVFLNYTDTLNDVFTVAHEMGHAMHTYYSNKTQKYTYAGYKIFVAEVASTCNEAILIDYLLKKSKDTAERKYLINHYLEQFKQTLFRQTMFAEFEFITHKMAEEGKILSADVLCRVYRELNEKYFGPDMEIDDQIALEWARIPHFYTPFYVYQYATGFSAAIAIAHKIINGDEKTLEGYKKFLSGGSSMHPIDLLKLCGIDMEKTEVILDAIGVFKELIEEFKRI